MNFLQSKNLDFKRIQEAVVLFAIACLTISYFGGYYLWITTIGHHSTLLREMAVVLLFLKVLTTRYHKKEFAVVAGLLLLAYVNYKTSGNARALYNFLLLCALKDVDLKKVFKVSLASVVFIVALMAILALTGVTGKVSVTEDFGRGGMDSYYSEVETRFYMGYIHPNSWAQAMFAMITLIVAAFYEKMDWKGILAIAVINYGVYRLAVSRTCFLAGLAVVILLIWAKYGQKLFEFFIIRLGILGGVSALWAIVFSVNIDLSRHWKWQWIDWKLFTGRINQAQIYFDQFGLSLWGENIPDKLEGGYVLDMGYMRMLLENGVVIFVLLYVMAMAVLVYAFKKKRNDIVIVTIGICLYGLYENMAIAQVPANLIVYYFAEFLYNGLKQKEGCDSVG